MDGAGELAVGVPVLVVRGGETQAKRELDRERRREPARWEPRREERDRRSDGQQVPRRAGVEDAERKDEEDADPGEQEERVGVAALPPSQDGGGWDEDGED